MTRTHSQELFRTAGDGNRRALGELISRVENDRRESAALLAGMCGDVDGFTVGIVGAPGVGKSTLVGALLGILVTDRPRVGVLAIDPTSPISGGAFLGDLIRMQAYAGQQNVFIRSMATRGHQGGLSRSAPEVVEVLRALKFDPLIIETSGAGQVDVEVRDVADTVVVVVVPGWGDSIQVAKAGLLEVADIFVVNKADQQDAIATVRDLERMLGYSRRDKKRIPKIVPTAAASGTGITGLWAEVLAHQAYLASTGERTERRRRQLATIIKRMALAELDPAWGDGALVELADHVLRRKLKLADAVAKAKGAAGRLL